MARDELTPAEQWGRVFTAALRRRGYTSAGLAREVGVRKSTVSKWVLGKSLPRHDVAVLVAEHMMEPTLVDLSMRLHTSTCPVDDKVFVRMGQNMRGTYCSSRCRATAMRRRGRPAVLNKHHFRSMRLRMFQDTLARHCRRCEPEGICRDETCEWRDLSPLPFSRLTT